METWASVQFLNQCENSHAVNSLTYFGCWWLMCTQQNPPCQYTEHGHFVCFCLCAAVYLTLMPSCHLGREKQTPVF